MRKLCSKCNLINFHDADECVRCQSELVIVSDSEKDEKKSFFGSKIFRRVAVCLAACLFTILGFYISLVGSSKALSLEQKQAVRASIEILRDRGFSGEVFLLDYLAAFRSNDNWLNALIEKENAYAATNFPFEIVTIYPDFSTFPVDDTERAAILLHEAQHLKGADEPEAYKFVWKNRKKLGWTEEKYGTSIIWVNVREQTKEFAPELFVCDADPLGDCTE